MAPILGVMVAMTLSLFALAGFIPWAKFGAANMINAAAAGQGRAVIKAVEQYVRDNSAIIYSNATATSAYEITFDTLKSAGYIPRGYIDKNPFKQTWKALVWEPTTGQLEIMVLSTGGRDIDAKHLPQIAAQMGAEGGYIPFTKQLGDSTLVDTTAVGAFGAWSKVLSNADNPGAGHLAALLAFTGKQETGGDFLYRRAVGQSELNAMQTDLSLTDEGGQAHDINGIDAVNAKSINASAAITGETYSGASNKFQVDASGRIGSSGFKPTDLPAGWGGGISTADVYGHGTIAVGTNAAVAASMTASGVMTAGSGKFQVNSNGVVSMASQGASGGTCSITAGVSAITTDTAGVPLACIKGVWRPIGGKQQKAGFYDGVDGASVPVPDCPNTATAQIIVYSKQIEIDPTASMSVGATGTGPWTIYVRNGSNTPVSGVHVQAETFCAFS